MTGMNRSYHLKMKEELYIKLQSIADKEGIDLSVLIRTFLWEKVKEQNAKEFELNKLHNKSKE